MKRGDFYRSRPDHYAQMRAGHMQRRRLSMLSAWIANSLECQGIKRGRILEVGSSNGDTLAYLASTFPEYRFAGSEPLEAYVQHAMARYGNHFPNLSFHLGSIHELDLGFEEYDLVFGIDVIHHIQLEQLIETCQAIDHALKPSGRLLFIEPNCWHPYMFLRQLLYKDERNFLPSRELAIMNKYFPLAERSFHFLFPGFYKNPSSALCKLEERIENIPFLGGSVCYQFHKKTK